MVVAINKFFGTILGLLDKISPNYAITLLFAALLFKIILFPFGIKQQKNSVRQAKLRPKEMAIRNKYKGRNDRTTQQKVQQEIFELYQTEGFNPASGCLPLLIQFPIIIFLYNAIRSPLSYICKFTDDIVNCFIRAAGTDNQISIIQKYTANPSAFDGAFAEAQAISPGFSPEVFGADLPKFTAFGNFFDLSMTPSFTGILVLVPLLVFAAQFFSMKLTRKFTFQPQQTGDAAKSMMIMDLVMPLMSVFFAFSFPAVLGVYWIYQSILGVLQQFLLSKMFPIPALTEEEIKEAEKQMKAQYKKNGGVSASAMAARAGTTSRPRSLHYIDDPEYQKKIEAIEAAEAAKADAEGEGKGKALPESPVPMKEDNPDHPTDDR